jgi:hypothetical protein
MNEKALKMNSKIVSKFYKMSFVIFGRLND